MQNEEIIAGHQPPTAAGIGYSPDNPPWGLLGAIGFWIVSVGLIIIVPALFVLPYASMRQVETVSLEVFLQNDKTAIILNVLAIIPAHILTIALSWYLIASGRKNGYFEILGWDLGPFKLWHGILIIVGFFVIAGVVGNYFPEQDNQLMKILRSSREVTILVALIATFSAPLVEEVVYRGVLYPAAKKSVGSPFAVVLVTLLFTLVHVPQYMPSYTTIFLLLLLSLVLTLVRAWTGRLLPCVLLHFVFNGLQSAALVAQPYLPQPTVDPAAVSLIVIAIPFI